MATDDGNKHMETKSGSSSNSGQAYTDIDEQPLEYFYNSRQWVEAQKLQNECCLKAAQNKKKYTGNIEEVLAKISVLQKELQEASTIHAVKELILHRLQLGDVLLKILFPPIEGAGDAQEHATDDKIYLELVKEQMGLVSYLLKLNKKMQELRPQLDDLKRKNLEMKKKNRELMSQLKEKQNAELDQQEDSSSGQRAKEKLDGIVNKVVVLRHIFQGLILGSGINWAQDPEMEKQVISLGTPLDV